MKSSTYVSIAAVSFVFMLLAATHGKSVPVQMDETLDSDGDGLSDTLENSITHTDPYNNDTDADDLSDFDEWYGTNTDPTKFDTDGDLLGDGEEVFVYFTDPHSADSDGDGLEDHFEVFTSYNLTSITPSVSYVIIGDATYNNRTDPLNRDTDGDGLFDGREGASGLNWGNSSLYPNASQVSYTPDPILLFNSGLSHPLDNDTDDDSYEQDYSGQITGRMRFLTDNSDYKEIFGTSVIFIDPETGEPMNPVIVSTNPANPDSDGDTGTTPEQRENPPFGFFLNSDGYELALDPPTDPTGDQDYDGLFDEFEAQIGSDPLKYDTDGDGLNDKVEYLLGSDVMSADTDLDGVTDGDEYWYHGTDVLDPDTDADGLSDGDEINFIHSNPFSIDSDSDGLNDSSEVELYLTSPTDGDTDHDEIPDKLEVFELFTDPTDGFDPDLQSPEVVYTGRIVYEYDDPKEITWEVSDNSPDSYRILENGTTVDAGSWNSSTPISWYLESSSLGIYNYTLLVNDTEGNNAVKTVMIEVTDTQAPLIVPSPDLHYSEGIDQFALNWTISDRVLGNYTLVENGEVYQQGDLNGSLQEVTVVVGSKQRGMYTYEMTASDNSGNRGSTLTVVTIEDDLSPVIVDIPPTELVYNRSAVQYKWEVYDLHPDYFTILLNGELKVSDSWSGGAISVDYSLFPEDGGYNLTIGFYDDSGNSLTISHHVIVDYYGETTSDTTSTNTDTSSTTANDPVSSSSSSEQPRLSSKWMLPLPAALLISIHLHGRNKRENSPFVE